MIKICNNIGSYGLRCRLHLASGRRLYHKNLLLSKKDSLKLAKNLYGGVEPTIGLEVHAQLKVNSKLFSHGANSSYAPPNSQLDLLDISLPGTLPKLNESALKVAILSSFGLNATVQDLIHFDRKNYFYTDMPAGYQITQYTKPVAKHGHIDFIVSTYHKSLIAHSVNYDLVRHVFWSERHLLEEFEPYVKRSHIRQIQLEQDSAKSLHEVSPNTGQELYSLVDYNRSGAALIEIVFEPDLCTHHEASSLVRELILTLKALDVCDCELQEGSLRIDSNVSIKSISGLPIVNSSRVELKNLNSLKALNRGIEHEIHRQAKLIEKGQKVTQESRTYDTKLNQTVPLRIKEDAVDYRYVPEPNIPPLWIDYNLVQQISQNQPKTLPREDGEMLISRYGLNLLLVNDIVDMPGLSQYFVHLMQNRDTYDPNLIADFLIYTIYNLNNIANVQIKLDLTNDSKFMKRLSPTRLQSIIDMVILKEMGFTLAYELIKYIYISGDQSAPRDIMRKLGWKYLCDINRIDELCLECTKSMKSISKKYIKKGERKHLFALLKRMCEITEDNVNIELAIERFDKLLKPSKI